MRMGRLNVVDVVDVVDVALARRHRERCGARCRCPKFCRARVYWRPNWNVRGGRDGCCPWDGVRKCDEDVRGELQVTAGRTSVADVTTRAWIGLDVSILEERGSGNNVDGLEALRTARSKKLKIIIKSAEVAHRGGVRLNDAAADGAAVVERRNDTIDAVLGVVDAVEKNAKDSVFVAVGGGVNLAVNVFSARAVRNVGDGVDPFKARCCEFERLRFALSVHGVCNFGQPISVDVVLADAGVDGVATALAASARRRRRGGAWRARL